MVYLKASGEKIREARKAANLTQAQLGEKMNVSGSMIGQYETEARRPSIKTAKKIASILGIDARALLVEFEADDWVAVPAAEALGAPSTLGRRQAEISSANQLLKALVDQYEGNLEDLLDGISQLSVDEQTALHDASLTLLVALRTGEATVGKPVATRTGGPQAAPAPQEGKDTIPPADTPETPPDGE